MTTRNRININTSLPVVKDKRLNGTKKGKGWGNCGKPVVRR